MKMNFFLQLDGQHYNAQGHDAFGGVYLQADMAKGVGHVFFHRSFRDVESFGDLFMFQAFDAAELKHFLLLRGQMSDGGVKVTLELVIRDFVEEGFRVLRYSADGLFPDEGFFKGNPAQRIIDMVAGDGRQPGFEVLDAGELFPVDPDFQEDLLQDVLGLTFRLEEFPGEINDPVAVVVE